ncbi:MAG: DNA-directed RNA polymerase subunit L [Nanoarchaeota archaeon]|nr:DNA-directed RNA polymerase subunit L [Nanoarchaeota archaeon]
MKVEVITDKKNELKFKISGADPHSFCNLLRVELLEDLDVITAGYMKEHPLYDYAIFTLKTKNKKPITVLKAGIKKIVKDLDVFEKKVKAVVK